MKRKREVEIMAQSLEAAGVEMTDAVKAAVAFGFKAVKTEKAQANQGAKAAYRHKRHASGKQPPLAADGRR